VSALFIGLKIAHVIAVVVGFGPLFVYPLMVRHGEGSIEVVAAMRAARARISEPAFLLVGPLGVLAATQHPDESVFGRLWVQLSIPLWLFAASVVWLVQRPLARKVGESAAACAAGDGSKGPELARRCAWLTRVTWISWAGLVGMLWLMVVQPA
jgi:uncharacterized membrane protein